MSSSSTSPAVMATPAAPARPTKNGDRRSSGLPGRPKGFSSSAAACSAVPSTASTGWSNRWEPGADGSAMPGATRVGQRKSTRWRQLHAPGGVRRGSTGGWVSAGGVRARRVGGRVTRPRIRLGAAAQQTCEPEEVDEAQEAPQPVVAGSIVVAWCGVVLVLRLVDDRGLRLTGRSSHAYGRHRQRCELSGKQLTLVTIPCGPLVAFWTSRTALLDSWPGLFAAAGKLLTEHDDRPSVPDVLRAIGLVSWPQLVAATLAAPEGLPRPDHRSAIQFLDCVLSRQPGIRSARKFAVTPHEEADPLPVLDSVSVSVDLTSSGRPLRLCYRSGRGNRSNRAELRTSRCTTSHMRMRSACLAVKKRWADILHNPKCTAYQIFNRCAVQPAHSRFNDPLK